MNNHEYGHCPHCNSVRLERQHRGFIRKYIVRIQPIFTCLHCEKRFSKRKIQYKKAFKQDFSRNIS